MIKSFSCKETQELFEGGSPRRFRAIQSVAERKLTQLDAAATLDFCVPHRAIVWRLCRVTVKDNGASA